jgi:hypothetical protein
MGAVAAIALFWSSVPNPAIAILHVTNQKGAAPVLKAPFFCPTILLHKREKSPEPSAVGHPAFKMALRCWPF